MDRLKKVPPALHLKCGRSVKEKQLPVGGSEKRVACRWMGGRARRAQLRAIPFLEGKLPAYHFLSSISNLAPQRNHQILPSPTTPANYPLPPPSLHLPPTLHCQEAIASWSLLNTWLIIERCPKPENNQKACSDKWWRAGFWKPAVGEGTQVVKLSGYY